MAVDVDKLLREKQELESQLPALKSSVDAAKAAEARAYAERDAAAQRYPVSTYLKEKIAADRALAANPNDPQLQAAARTAGDKFRDAKANYEPYVAAADQATQATIQANSAYVDIDTKAGELDVAVAKSDPSKASPEANAYLKEQQESSNTTGNVQSERVVSSTEIGEGTTTERNNDGSSVTTDSSGEKVYYESDGSQSSSGPEEPATNDNAGQRDYSNNGDQVPGVQVFDDGSTLQTFDDGSTLATGTDGSISSSPSTDNDSPTGRISPKAFEKGASAKAEWKEAKDLRAILRVPPSYLTKYTDPAGVLKNFGGIVFPYTPQISLEHQASFNSINPVHSNYTQYFYKNSAVSQISVTGKFTVQNEEDGIILLGVIHLLRALTKMRFGPDKDSGAPPPVCRLQAYGDYMLQNVPVAVSSFRHELPDSVDYFAVGRKNNAMGPNLVPVLSTITLSLTPMWSRSEQMAAGVDNWLKGTDRAKGYL